MLKLRGRADASGQAWPLADDVWRVCLPADRDSDRDGAGDQGPAKSLACLVRAGQPAPPGYGLYLTTDPETGTLAVPGTPRLAIPPAPGPVLKLGPELAHLSPGDIIHVAAGARRVTVLWKNSARHNALLLTEQCDNYCLMCSQPPKEARRFLAVRPGQEGDQPPACERAFPQPHRRRADPARGALIGLLDHCQHVVPELSIHLLSNGRRFADPAFARRYAAVGLADIMAGIPVYAPEPGLHDFIVQASGAFDETIHGILNLASLGQAVEIRVVVQRHTVPVLASLATFIVRNLPFVAQVALMGLEMTGLARPNSALVWADPADYQRELAEAVGILVTAGISARIYNHQLCVLDRRLWPFAVRSISDWKNDYLDICRSCSVRDACGGVFTTSGNRLSQHLRPVP